MSPIKLVKMSPLAGRLSPSTHFHWRGNVSANTIENTPEKAPHFQRQQQLEP